VHYFQYHYADPTSSAVIVGVPKNTIKFLEEKIKGRRGGYQLHVEYSEQIRSKNSGIVEARVSASPEEFTESAAELVQGIVQRRSMPEFHWRIYASGTQEFPEFSSLSERTKTIISMLTRDRQVRKKEAVGGILPVCIDPDTREPFGLLGLSLRGEYCHFHGWVDPGETTLMGAAREAFEEGRGVFGNAFTLLYALSVPLYHCRVREGTGPTPLFLVSLGELTRDQREKVRDDFRAVTPHVHGMSENKDIAFFNLRELRTACLTLTECVHISGMGTGEILRPFLRQWLATRDMWASTPKFSEILDEGVFPETFAPLSTLEPMSQQEMLEISLFARFFPNFRDARSLFQSI
jgi:hypothetical protein